MKVVYGIFAAVGWVWCLIALLYVVWRVRRERVSVVRPHTDSNEILP